MATAQKDDEQPDIPADNLDHVDLWKYFEERDARVKDTMFNVVTWIVGYAAVVLGLIVKEAVSLSAGPVGVSKPWTLTMLSAVGMVIVVYAYISLRGRGAPMEGRDRCRAGETHIC